ncbi:MAG: hypothetical protein ACPGOV_12415 [Magnetovibrionaceae bacterium]
MSDTMSELKAIARLKNLLKEAEQEISSLRAERDEYLSMVTDLQINCNTMEVHMGHLTAKTRDMEGKLDEAGRKFTEAQTALEIVKSTLKEVQDLSDEALETAKQSTSRVELAANLFNMVSKTKLDDELKIIEETQTEMEEVKGHIWK